LKVIKTTGGRDVRLLLFIIPLAKFFKPANEAIDGWAEQKCHKEENEEYFLPSNGNDWFAGNDTNEE